MSACWTKKPIYSSSLNAYSSKQTTIPFDCTIFVWRSKMFNGSLQWVPPVFTLLRHSSYMYSLLQRIKAVKEYHYSKFNFTKSLIMTKYWSFFPTTLPSPCRCLKRACATYPCTRYNRPTDERVQNIKLTKTAKKIIVPKVLYLYIY